MFRFCWRRALPPSCADSTLFHALGCFLADRGQARLQRNALQDAASDLRKAAAISPGDGVGDLSATQYSPLNTTYVSVTPKRSGSNVCVRSPLLMFSLPETVQTALKECLEKMSKAGMKEDASAGARGEAASYSAASSHTQGVLRACVLHPVMRPRLAVCG